MLNWISLWEQFEVSIHSKDQLFIEEKLACFRHSFKDGPARHMIKRLSGNGNNYAEAVECLRKRYDRPRLLHEAHVIVLSKI